MQLIVDATADELEELAKMAYVAQFVFDSSGEFTTGYSYPKIKEFDAALRTLNKALLQALPNTKLLEIDEGNSNVFTHTIQMENECRPILQEFSNDTYIERVCTEITTRDYIEQGGTLETASSLYSDVFKILYKRNKVELKQYGLSRFKLED